MKKITFTLFLYTILVSCSGSDDEVIDSSALILQNACTGENPVELEWFQNLIAELGCGEYSCRVSILKTTYEGETVFYKQVTDPLCNAVNEIDLYNCKGEIIEEFDPEESREFINNRGSEAEEIFFCNE
ncbi:hypothetical protein [Salinimicrobium sp. HB62]|uniref:hypothetical protein n=1 Tax=Salinimicrobium sp. HB62 TaxID=3077781 RepID=UPI002D7A14E4|nr:hypothetical protein [Salinimicrobium sp. HB62]